METQKRKGIWNHAPTFIYPEKEYSRIPMTTDVVKALEKRDFRVPNVKVKFSLSGSGMRKFKYVSIIEFDQLDIRIWFCYVQGTLPGYNGRLNDIAGLSECHIKKHSAHFYTDNSGNQHWEYIGSDWNKDLQEFRDMQYEDQRYEKPFRTYNKWLSHEAKSIFDGELEKFIQYIETFPETQDRTFKESLAETEEDFERYKFDLYPENYPTLYVFYKSFSRGGTTLTNFRKRFCDLDDTYKIADLGGERLVHWRSVANDIPNQDEVPYPKLANDCFSWASAGEEGLEYELRRFKSWTPSSSLDTYFIFEIRPHYLDDIYVADLSIAEEYRAKCFESTESLSDEQYGKYIALRGVRLVTLKEYIENQLKFKKPQYLIRKSIGYDEISRIFRIKNKHEIKADPGSERIEILNRV